MIDLQKKTEGSARISFILAMVIFGTIGIFVRNIPLSSGIIASVRGILGSVFLYMVIITKKGRISREAVKVNIRALIWSGILIGTNWTFLFEAYNYTSVAIATLCCYLAPVFIILLSPLFLKERLTAKKILCVLAALSGMVLISGVFKGKLDMSQIRGILYGTTAAMLYVFVIIMNKKMEDIDVYDRTAVQLLVAGLTVLPYGVLAGDMVKGKVTVISVMLLLIIAIVHTGITYAIYFGALENITAQTTAILSYIDPVVAVALSIIVLKDPFDIYGMAGMILILGATFISERG